MTNWRWVLPAIVLYTSACASSVPAPKPAPAPVRASASPARFEADQFRKELEDVYAQILLHEKNPVNAPRVDVEAAASIPIPEHRTIHGALSLFTNEMHDDIQASLIRSARYKKLIDKALDAEGLPKGLAYLPVIESAYMPSLTSRAGAHGIWQFMPETAREYGLRVDWWVDDRADPERSTRAAAEYIRDLYRQFNDWPLTLAAYNAGPGRIRRALDAAGVSTFWQLLDAAVLPKETRGYVPTFYATLIIATDPQTYGFRLGDPLDIDERMVDVAGPVSLKYIADVAGVDEQTIRELNPALRRGIVPPGHAPVRLPAGVAQAVASRAGTLRNEDANVAICSFTLRSGDSLKRLARAIGTSPDTILAMNHIRSASALGRGDSIYLPVRARELGTLLAHFNEPDVFYKVRKGDTLYSIARNHGLSVEELRDLNDLPKHSPLHAGQKLRVSVPRTVTAGGM